MLRDLNTRYFTFATVAAGREKEATAGGGQVVK